MSRLYLRLFLRLSLRLSLFLCAALALFALDITPAQAVCGKECKEARDYCKNWEKDHPGEECGRVRGAICSGSSWTKIKQVNWAWSACKLVGSSTDYNNAQARCDEYEEGWGGTCQVHSPYCNAGWARLGKYGAFRACRPRELSGDLLYDGYKAYMRKWEGKAQTPIPAHLHFFIKREYGIDPNWVRWGTVSDTSNSTCITDCNRIYCDADYPEDRVKDGYRLHATGDDLVTDLLFHELTHVQQCKEVGGRQDYAHLWFSNASKGLGRAIRDGGKISADEIHDFQPMEIEASSTGSTVRQRYVDEWWHIPARCRIYKPDKRTIVYTSNDAHPRAFCDPQVGWQGAKNMTALVPELAKEHGDGTFHLALGVPSENNGVWLGEVKVKHKILESALGATVSGDACPKKLKIRVVMATEGPRFIRLRYKVGERNWSGWRTLKAKAGSLVAGGGGYLAVFEESPQDWLEPGNHRVLVAIDGEQKGLQADVKVTCPPFAATKISYAVRAEDGPFCPRGLRELVNFETNGPGMVQFGFRIKGRGDLSTATSYKAQTERSGNRYVASYLANRNITDDLDLERRAETLGNDVIFSEWEKLKIDCLDISESEIKFSGEDEATCLYKSDVKLRVKGDMRADLPYRLDCSDGQSATGTFAIRRKGAAGFIGDDDLKLDVTKTGKQICALKADLGAGLKNLTLQGKDYICLDVLDAAIFIDGPEQARCPAELPLRMRVNARDKTPVGYILSCNTDQSWNGRLRVEETGPNTYLGIKTETLKVTKSGKIACALKSTLSGTPKVVALRGKDFQCVAVAVPDRPSSVAPPPRPAVPQSEPPPRPVAPKRVPPQVKLPDPPKAVPPVRTPPKVAPPARKPTIVCRNGTLRGETCSCPRGWTARKVNPFATICDRPVVQKISCTGGKVSGNRCVCPSGAVQKKLSATAYRCDCPRGTKLIRGICVRPAG